MEQPPIPKPPLSEAGQQMIAAKAASTLTSPATEQKIEHPIDTVREPAREKAAWYLNEIFDPAFSPQKRQEALLNILDNSDTAFVVTRIADYVAKHPDEEQIAQVAEKLTTRIADPAYNVAVLHALTGFPPEKQLDLVASASRHLAAASRKATSDKFDAYPAPFLLKTTEKAIRTIDPSQQPAALEKAKGILSEVAGIDWKKARAVDKNDLAQYCSFLVVRDPSLYETALPVFDMLIETTHDAALTPADTLAFENPNLAINYLSRIAAHAKDGKIPKTANKEDLIRSVLGTLDTALTKLPEENRATQQAATETILRDLGTLDLSTTPHLGRLADILSESNSILSGFDSEEVYQAALPLFQKILPHAPEKVIGMAKTLGIRDASRGITHLKNIIDAMVKRIPREGPSSADPTLTYFRYGLDMLGTLIPMQDTDAANPTLSADSEAIIQTLQTVELRDLDEVSQYSMVSGFHDLAAAFPALYPRLKEYLTDHAGIAPNESIALSDTLAKSDPIAGLDHLTAVATPILDAWDTSQRTIGRHPNSYDAPNRVITSLTNRLLHFWRGEDKTPVRENAIRSVLKRLGSAEVPMDPEAFRKYTEATSQFIINHRDPFLADALPLVTSLTKRSARMYGDEFQSLVRKLYTYNDKDAMNAVQQAHNQALLEQDRQLFESEALPMDDKIRMLIRTGRVPLAIVGTTEATSATVSGIMEKSQTDYRIIHIQHPADTENLKKQIWDAYPESHGGLPYEQKTISGILRFLQRDEKNTLIVADNIEQWDEATLGLFLQETTYLENRWKEEPYLRQKMPIILSGTESPNAIILRAKDEGKDINQFQLYFGREYTLQTPPAPQT